LTFNISILYTIGDIEKMSQEDRMKYWSKSALTIYRYLETMSNTIDKIVVTTGKTSYSSLLQKYQSTYYQAGKIIELVERKRKMINLKIAVEDAYSNLSVMDRRIVGLVYVDGVKSERVAKLLNMSLRTFFRRKLVALNNFSDEMELAGFNSEFFLREYAKERWFMSVYDDCLQKGSGEDSINSRVVKQVFNELGQVDMVSTTY